MELPSGRMCSHTFNVDKQILFSVYPATSETETRDIISEYLQVQGVLQNTTLDKLSEEDTKAIFVKMYEERPIVI